MTKIRKMYVGLILILLAILFIGLYTQKEFISTQGTPTEGPAVDNRYGNGVKQNTGVGVDLSYLRDYVSSIKAGALTDQEKEDILHMREEEKLARDVYLTLYEKWKYKVFYNIAQSEQTHMDAVKILIDKYGLKDPVEDNDIGKFTDPEFQKLYNQLVEEGSKSLVDALKVGALIEELDIADLEKCLNATDKPDIIIVYQSLMKGSRNHLRSFTRNLENLGITYKPQYISMDEYEQIVNSEMERGP